MRGVASSTGSLVGVSLHDLAADVAAVIEACAKLASFGVDQAIFNSPNVAEPDFFDILGNEIIPEVSKIAIAGR